jgi:predicted NAD-dependent protein-ADP-ribosyltransferase YbiA (DUF1768 family)
MEHKKTLFYFESKGVEWMVEYFYETETRYGHEYQNQRARIYTDGDLYHDFEKMPYTKTVNLTKTHAKEVITIAKKINKERDKISSNRDKKLKKILDGAN